MAIISKNNMDKLQALLGESYEDMLAGYGTINTYGTAASSIMKSKAFIRGGTDANNGVRASSMSGTTVLDLFPSKVASDTKLTIRRGKFYVNGVLKELTSDVTVECDVEDAASLDTPASWSWGATGNLFVKGKIYASEVTVKKGTTWEVTDVTSSETTMRLTASSSGGTGFKLAQIIDDTTASGITIDEVKLYLKKSGSPNCNLRVLIVDETGTGPAYTPDLTDVKATSAEISIDDISTDVLEIGFPLLSQVSLNNTGTGDYFIILESTAPETGTYTVDATNYIQWVGNSSGAGVVAPHNSTTNERQVYSAAAWGASGSPTNGCAHRLVSYIHAAWTASGSTGSVGIHVDHVDEVVAPSPTVPFAPIADVTMLSNGSGASENFDAYSTMTDVREIIGYEGLEDDDQMDDLFSSMDTTENYIINVVNEATTTEAVRGYSSICSALASHVSSLVSGYTFKTYWGGDAVQLEFDRYFRKIWYLNQSSQELYTTYGVRINTGSSIKWDVAGANWVSNNTYCVNMTTGTDLELLTPLGGTANDASAAIMVLAIKPAWAELQFDHTTGSSVTKLTLSSVPTSWGTTAASHV